MGGPLSKARNAIIKKRKTEKKIKFAVKNELKFEKMITKKKRKMKKNMKICHENVLQYCFGMTSKFLIFF